MYCIKTKYSQYRLTFNTPGTAFTVNIFQYISLELKFCILFMLECPVSLNLMGVFLTSILYVRFKNLTICGQSKYTARIVDLTYRRTPAGYFALLDPTPGRSVVTGTPGTQVRLPHFRVL